MANDITTTPAWMPKQTIVASKWIRYAILGVLGFAALKLFNGAAPTMVDALRLAEQLFQHGIYALVAFGGLLATYFGLISLFSKKGLLNALVTSMINLAVRRWIATDPVQPILDRIASVAQNKETVDVSKSRVRGTMGNMQQKAIDFRSKAHKAEDTARAAHGKAQYAASEQIAIRQARTYSDTADKLEMMYHRMEPIYQTLSNVSQACDVMVQNLQAESESLRATWDAQKAMGAATDAANDAMGFTKSQQWNMAEEAENIINTKYGEELGRLDDLTASIEPTLQTMNLEDATFSEELFSKVQADAGKVVQMTQALPAPGIVLPMDAGQSSETYSSFIRN